jgi:hypothetical protein
MKLLLIVQYSSSFYYFLLFKSFLHHPVCILSVSSYYSLLLNLFYRYPLTSFLKPFLSSCCFLLFKSFLYHSVPPLLMSKYSPACFVYLFFIISSICIIRPSWPITTLVKIKIFLSFLLLLGLYQSQFFQHVQ